jgi:bifunctional NMN adenylyltransferase/nudix hydrolase
MNKTYDMAVFIGRLAPFTKAHEQNVRTALNHAKKVTVILGSANTPRSHRHPFTFDERAAMVKAAFPDDADRIFCEPVEDTVYNNEQWTKNVQAAVKHAFDKAYGAWHPLASVALVGHGKDSSSFYLKLFPQWESINVPNYKNINATDVREKFFSSAALFEPVNNVLSANELPLSTIDFLHKFSMTADYRNIVDEYEFVAKYRSAWDAAPFPPMFITVDSVIVQSGHILLVERGARPGKGLWALPGGFLRAYDELDKKTGKMKPADKTMLDGAIRELREETKIKVPEAVLRGSVKAAQVFSDPNRSSRGRTVTHAFLIHLPPDVELPKVKGSDDAKKAKWVPLADVKRNMMFEDHKDIIDTMTALIKD